MLKVRGQRAVERASRPAIAVGAHVLNHSVAAGALEARLQLRTDLAQHRLDRQDHSFTQLQTAAALPVVVNLRLLVHLPADAMTDEVADDMEAARLRMLLHRCPDVTEVTSRAHLFDGQVEAFFRRPDQLLRARSHLSNRNRDRAIAYESLEDRSEVEAEDVPFLQLRP